MIRTDNLDDTISQYYDNEMNESELLNYEARLALSKGVKDYTNNICFEYYKITNSINKIKFKSETIANKITNNVLNEVILKKEKSLFYIYSVFLKRFYKRLRSFFLNFLRNNSK